MIIMLYVHIIILHVDINESHVNIIMLHVDLNVSRKYATIDKRLLDSVFFIAQGTQRASGPWRIDSMLAKAPTTEA